LAARMKIKTDPVFAFNFGSRPVTAESRSLEAGPVSGDWLTVGDE